MTTMETVDVRREYLHEELVGDGRWRAVWSVVQQDGVLVVRSLELRPRRAVEAGTPAGGVTSKLLRELSPVSACAMVALRELGYQQWLYESFSDPDVIADPTRRLKVEVPTSRIYPDDFYKQVACRFLQLRVAGDRQIEDSGDRLSAAKELADANGVPVTTVHRWVKEARRRGFLSIAGVQV